MLQHLVVRVISKPISPRVGKQIADEPNSDTDKEGKRKGKKVRGMRLMRMNMMVIRFGMRSLRRNIGNDDQSISQSSEGESVCRKELQDFL